MIMMHGKRSGQGNSRYTNYRTGLVHANLILRLLGPFIYLLQELNEQDNKAYFSLLQRTRSRWLLSCDSPLSRQSLKVSPRMVQYPSLALGTPSK